MNRNTSFFLIVLILCGIFIISMSCSKENDEASSHQNPESQQSLPDDMPGINIGAIPDWSELVVYVDFKDINGFIDNLISEMPELFLIKQTGMWYFVSEELGNLGSILEAVDTDPFSDLDYMVLSTGGFDLLSSENTRYYGIISMSYNADKLIELFENQAGAEISTIQDLKVISSNNLIDAALIVDSTNNRIIISSVDEVEQAIDLSKSGNNASMTNDSLNTAIQEMAKNNNSIWIAFDPSKIFDQLSLQAEYMTAGAMDYNAGQDTNGLSDALLQYSNHLQTAGLGIILTNEITVNMFMNFDKNEIAGYIYDIFNGIFSAVKLGADFGMESISTVQSETFNAIVQNLDIFSRDLNAYNRENITTIKLSIPESAVRAFINYLEQSGLSEQEYYQSQNNLPIEEPASSQDDVSPDDFDTGELYNSLMELQQNVIQLNEQLEQSGTSNY